MPSNGGACSRSGSSQAARKKTNASPIRKKKKKEIGDLEKTVRGGKDRRLWSQNAGEKNAQGTLPSPRGTMVVEIVKRKELFP